MPVEVCDVCGSSDIKEIKCKIVCQNCGTILKSCADLYQLRTAGQLLLRIAD
jgi:ribosomal protein L37AE/L43A